MVGKGQRLVCESFGGCGNGGGGGVISGLRGFEG